ncbi:MAG TPA: glycosyltransferase [Candidatus Limnocylindria bacterium]|nr:glycosyltransferase [Candidatus Limnocylindria bacterium]
MIVKLLIGIPTNGQPARPFLDALRGLALPSSLEQAERVVWSGNFVAAQREMIVREALRRDCDAVVMIDDDMVPPPDTLTRLLAVFEADPRAAVVGALYYSRDGARPMVVGRWNSQSTTSACIPPFRSDAFSPVDGVGFGCVAIRTAALRDLESPYFGTHVYIDPSHQIVRQCDEDYLFCERVRRAGWNVYVHGGARTPHYDRASDTLAPVQWESDADTNRLRMIVRDGDQTRLVPFDDAVPQAPERQEPFASSLLIVG